MVNRWSSVRSPRREKIAGPRFWKLESSRRTGQFNGVVVDKAYNEQDHATTRTTVWRSAVEAMVNFVSRHLRRDERIEDEGQSIRADLLYPSIAK